MRMLYKSILSLYKFLKYKLLAGFVNGFSIIANSIDIKPGYKLRGFVYFDCHKTARIVIGEGFVANSAFLFNHIGRQRPTSVIAKKNAVIQIGNNVGMSATTLVAQKMITIGDNVRIGGNTVIYDSDFHSLDLKERTSVPEIKTNIRCRQVTIENNVFIGAHVTILKGTHIGENSIIGACSVISGHVPPNEIWAGNPAKFIKKLKTPNDYASGIVAHT